MRIYK